jgi:hypothetical protein
MTNTTDKQAFLIYKSFYEPIKDLSPVSKGRLLDAIFQYQINGTMPELDGSVSMAFSFFLNQFRLDADKYQAVVERNKNNGLKGGRPKKDHNKSEEPTITHNNPNNPVGLKEPKKADNGNDNGNEKENDNVNDKVYFYTGRTIKLTKEDYDRWQTNYPNINLARELPSLDDFYTEAKEQKWFVRCSQALANKNKKAPIVKIQKGSL